MKTNKGFTTILVIIIGLLIIGASFYFYISSEYVEPTKGGFSEDTLPIKTEPTPSNKESELPKEEKISPEPAISLPYCNNPDPGYHLSLAKDFIQNKYNSDYSVIEETEEMTGPCNNGNIAWTRFDVEDASGNPIGYVIVNGDTEEVEFEYYSNESEGV